MLMKGVGKYLPPISSCKSNQQIDEAKPEKKISIELQKGVVGRENTAEGHVINRCFVHR